MSGNRLRAMEAADLRQVLIWRNHPEVRRNMFKRQEIRWEEHVAWFNALEDDPTRHVLLYEEGGLRLGVVTLKQLRCASVAEWGFYRAPDAAKGTGLRMGIQALNYAFDTLGLHKVYGEVIGSNSPSIGFHRRLRFSQEGLLRDHFEVDGCFSDVLCFGLLAAEWKASEGLKA